MPSALVAGKKFTLFGKEYERGDDVPDAGQLPLERLRALQSVGMLVPATEEAPKTDKKEAKTSG